MFKGDLIQDLSTFTFWIGSTKHIFEVFLVPLRKLLYIVSGL